MKYQDHNDKPIGDIIYLTGLSGDTPISNYVIRGSEGDMLIDTGFAGTYKPLLKWIRENGFNITDIFLTHAHPDHDWNAARLKKTLGARIWLNRKDVTLIRNFSSQPQHPLDERFTKRVKKITFWTGTIVKSKAYQPDVIISGDDSETPSKYGYGFDIVELPGHTLGSMGILKGDTLYCGDAFVIFNREPMLPVHATSLELMRASAERIRTIAPRYLACSHGVPVEFSGVEFSDN